MNFRIDGKVPGGRETVLFFKVRVSVVKNEISFISDRSELCANAFVRVRQSYLKLLEVCYRTVPLSTIIPCGPLMQNA